MDNLDDFGASSAAGAFRLTLHGFFNDFCDEDFASTNRLSPRPCHCHGNTPQRRRASFKWESRSGEDLRLSPPLPRPNQRTVNRILRLQLTKSQQITSSDSLTFPASKKVCESRRRRRRRCCGIGNIQQSAALRVCGCCKSRAISLLTQLPNVFHVLAFACYRREHVAACPLARSPVFVTVFLSFIP